MVLTGATRALTRAASSRHATEDVLHASAKDVREANAGEPRRATVHSVRLMFPPKFEPLHGFLSAARTAIVLDDAAWPQVANRRNGTLLHNGSGAHGRAIARSAGSITFIWPRMKSVKFDVLVHMYTQVKESGTTT